MEMTEKDLAHHQSTIDGSDHFVDFKITSGDAKRLKFLFHKIQNWKHKLKTEKVSIGKTHIRAFGAEFSKPYTEGIITGKSTAEQPSLSLFVGVKAKAATTKDVLKGIAAIFNDKDVDAMIFEHPLFQQEDTLENSIRFAL